MSNAATARREANRRAQRRRQLLYAGIAVVVVVLVVLVAVLSMGERDAAVSVEDIAGDPVVSGEPLATLPSSGVDPLVGEPAPTVEGADFAGTPVSIGDGSSPELVMFMASWCPACQQELPEVVAWMDQGGLPDGVELTAVATGLDASRPNWPPDEWFVEEGYTGPVVVDDAEGSVAGAYGLSATPFWVALDADGQVVARIAGMLDQTQMTALAEAALATSD
jgi:cytochrome c biogenesis protein CcmG, thiol:disulfide interchange protein DsbE